MMMRMRGGSNEAVEREGGTLRVKRLWGVSYTCPNIADVITTVMESGDSTWLKRFSIPQIFKEGFENPWYSELCEYAEKVQQLPYAITVETPFGKVGITHAEPATDDWDEFIQKPTWYEEAITWGRSVVYQKDCAPTKGVFKTIHGHTPLTNPYQVGNALFIDCGAVFGGELCICNLSKEVANA